jgi:hypothetical protein
MLLPNPNAPVFRAQVPLSPQRRNLRLGRSSKSICLTNYFHIFIISFFDSLHSFAPKLTNSRGLCKKFERLGARLIARFRPNRSLSPGIRAPIHHRIISMSSPAVITGFYGIHTTSAPAPARIQMPLRSIFLERRSTCGESACGRRIHGSPTVLRLLRTALGRHQFRGVALALLA